MNFPQLPISKYIKFTRKVAASNVAFPYNYNIQEEVCSVLSKYLDIQINWKCDTEIVRVCEHFPANPGPLFCNFTNLSLIHGVDVEVNVGAALADAEGALNGQHLLACLSLDDEPRFTEGPLLLHHTNHVPWRRLDLHLL